MFDLEYQLYIYMDLKMRILFHWIYLFYEKLVPAPVPLLVINILYLTKSVWLIPHSSSISELGTGCKWFVSIVKGVEAPQARHINPCGPPGCHYILIYV